MPIAQSAAQTLGSCAQARRVILSRGISDHWKEKVMPAYALRMGRQSLVLTFYFAILVAVTAAVLWITKRILPDATAFIDSAHGLAFGFLVSILYFMVRRRVVGA
jgi:hypothetical protein